MLRNPVTYYPGPRVVGTLKVELLRKSYWIHLLVYWCPVMTTQKYHLESIMPKS